MPRLRYDPSNDYYALLGLTPRATPSQIQRAFHRLAKEVHPDRHPDDQAWATARFQALNEAYHVLDDPDLRREYDRLRWPHARFEPSPASSAAAGEAWAGYRAAEAASESGSGRIDEEWFRRARWEYTNWVRTSPPPPAPVPPRNHPGLSLLALLRGPFGWVYLLLVVTILLMPLIYLLVTGWMEQTTAWLHQPNPTALPESACPRPDVLITTPLDGEWVATRFDVLGSAAPLGFAEYRLELAPAIPAEDAQLATAQAAIAAPSWALLAPPARIPIKAGVLATGVDLAGRASGPYVLRLTVRLTNGDTLPPCERVIRYESR